MKKKHQDQDSPCKEKCQCIDICMQIRYLCSYGRHRDIHGDDSVARTQVVTASRDAPSQPCSAWSPVAAAEARAVLGLLCALPVQWCGCWEWTKCHCLPRPTQESQTHCQYRQSGLESSSQWISRTFVSRAVLWPPRWANSPSSSHVTRTSSWVWVWTRTWLWKPFSGAHTLISPSLWGSLESFGLPCNAVCEKLLTTWCNSQSSNKKPQGSVINDLNINFLQIKKGFGEAVCCIKSLAGHAVTLFSTWHLYFSPWTPCFVLIFSFFSLQDLQTSSCPRPSLTLFCISLSQSLIELHQNEFQKNFSCGSGTPRAEDGQLHYCNHVFQAFFTSQAPRDILSFSSSTSVLEKYLKWQFRL